MKLGVKNLANIKSAIKRVKVSADQNLRNRMVKSEMKTAIRRFDETASGDQAAATYVNAVSAVDKAAGKGVIHKNAANRKKAQLAKKRAVAE